MTKSSFRVLERDIDTYETTNLPLLYLNCKILDFFNQLTFRGENMQQNYLPTHAAFSECLKETQLDPKENKKLRDIIGKFNMNILDAVCTDITWHSNDHFSKVFILNACKVITSTKFIKKVRQLSDAQPVILIVNTLQGATGHAASTLAKTVRKFLNKINPLGNSDFKTTMIPHHVLDGKFFMIVAP